MGCHDLPDVLGRRVRTGINRAQRLCLPRDQHALGNERHLIFGFSALHFLWTEHRALFGADIEIMLRPYAYCSCGS